VVGSTHLTSPTQISKINPFQDGKLTLLLEYVDDMIITCNGEVKKHVLRKKIILNDLKIKYKDPMNDYEATLIIILQLELHATQYNMIEPSTYILTDMSLEEKIDSGIVTTTKPPSEVQLANEFTKRLPTKWFQDLASWE
jgi:hypothetical protein